MHWNLEFDIVCNTVDYSNPNPGLVQKQKFQQVTENDNPSALTLDYMDRAFTAVVKRRMCIPGRRESSFTPKAVFGSSLPQSPFALLQNACYDCLGNTWEWERREDFEVFAYKYFISISRAVQSCIYYFPLSEFGSRPFDCSHTLCFEEFCCLSSYLEKDFFFFFPAAISDPANKNSLATGQEWNIIKS